ncbi:zinc-binding dehydrogenase [Streptomyces sp. 3211.6]|uniref:zinc-binding dehydrogenase n=1 Tax=Streptomyces sp. 3211.6 TaxID=1938845 RepID=UPI001C9DF3B5|nr:zinc-binding dehydrogenase [Streptomyces sp. 3211.6]
MRGRPHRGPGAEFVFDAVAAPGVLEPGRAVAPGGILLMHGAPSGEPTPCPGFELGLPALNMRTFTAQEITTDPGRLRRAEAFVTSGLRDGSSEPVGDRVFGLDEIVEAHRSMEAGLPGGEDRRRRTALGTSGPPGRAGPDAHHCRRASPPD